jgi:RNA polymerase sigma-70 factor (ECF subfamily)
VPALAGALHGRDRVARTLMVWVRLGLQLAGGSFRRVEVNGQPGALGLDRDGGLISVMALDIADGQIQGVSSIVNPDKIGHVGRVGDMRALLKRD